MAQLTWPSHNAIPKYKQLASIYPNGLCLILYAHEIIVFLLFDECNEKKRAWLKMQPVKLSWLDDGKF